MKCRILIFLFSLVFPLTSSGAELLALPQDNSSAVILVYHRVGEDGFPATSIRQEQFEDHVKELLSGGYTVLPLPEIIDALRAGRSLPDRAVALTFDGNYRSAFKNAMPLLLRHNIPFTIFIAPAFLKEPGPHYIKPADIKKLARNKLVTVGLHPDQYIRLNGKPEEEIRRQINNAITHYRDLFNRTPDLFSYPFGEYSLLYRNIVTEAGFKAALGQQSGVAHVDSDLYALPRFPMTDSYGGHERFRLIANALPLPVRDIEPADPHLATRQTSIGFTVDDALAGHLADLSCFISGQDQIDIEHIGKNRVELRMEKPFEDDRARINCTLPVSVSEDARWRWFGLLITF